MRPEVANLQGAEVPQYEQLHQKTASTTRLSNAVLKFQKGT